MSAALARVTRTGCAGRRVVLSGAFETTLLVAPFLAGCGFAAVVLAAPALFPALLLVDLWFLGYHHVVATYTRLAFDATSLRENRRLAVDLLVLVVAATLVLAFTAGAWAVASAFLYLQWFHYMRQGYGIARLFYRATPDGQAPGARDWLADAVIYLVPIYGIAYRSSVMGETFLGMAVRVVVPPSPLVLALGAAAGLAVAAWALRTAYEALNGRGDARYAAFVLSHAGIFFLGYVAIDRTDAGWLAVNVWHNLQYVLVVWMTNRMRYAAGVDPRAPFLSGLSQPGRAAAYFGACVLISTLVYLALSGITVFALGGGLALMAGVYMGINFHHYVVDALIWKRRRPAPAAA